VLERLCAVDLRHAETPISARWVSPGVGGAFGLRESESVCACGGREMGYHGAQRRDTNQRLMERDFAWHGGILQVRTPLPPFPGEVSGSQDLAYAIWKKNLVGVPLQAAAAAKAIAETGAS